MRALSLRAQFYLCAIAAAAITAAIASARVPLSGWAEAGLAVGLAVVASLAQSFELRTPRKAYVTTLAFLLAAALMIGPAGCILVAALPFAVEQLHKPKTAYIQVFNASSHVLSTLGAWAAYHAVAGSGSLHGQTAAVLGATLAVAVFLVSNHTLLALVLWWARGLSPRDSELFGPESLVTDLGLLALGVVIAGLWALGPALVAFALVPFALLQRALYFPELQRASRTDPKTGLVNSAYFNEVAGEEIRRAIRTGHPLCVLVADLDLLRNINNAYGHLAGDVILRGVANILREEVREYDVVSRFGGEEFALLLPSADAEEGRQVAERIRGRVAREGFDVTTSVTPIRTTISLGLAVLGENGDTIDELIHAADLAVYRAKVEGRDRVCIAHPEDDLATGPRDLGHRPASPVVRLFVSEPAAAPPAEPVAAVPAPAAAVAPAAAATPDAAPDAAPRVTERRTPRPAPRRATRRTLPVTMLVVLLAAIASWGALLSKVPLTRAVVVFPLLALVAELSGENIYASSFVSLSAVPILAAVAAGRPLAALAAALVSGIAGGLAGRARPEQVIFNVANFVFATATAMLLRLAIPVTGPLEPSDLAVLLPLMMGVTTAYFLLDNGMVSVVIARDEGRKALDVFRADFAWLAPHFLAFGALGTLLGVSWESFGAWGLVAFLLPPLLIRVAQKQYLAKTASNVAELRRLADDLQDSKEQLEDTNVALERALLSVRERHLATARALAGAIDARDKTTGGHIERVSALGQAMCAIVDPILASDPQVAFGFLLHDVGKIGVPDSVLLKAGPLTKAERRIIEQHPAIGEVLLRDAGFANVAREIVLSHHERWDGSGYPRGLKGTEIPLCSRIFAVADSIDAMTNDRPYRQGMPLDEAFAELERHAGTQFDPAAVEALLSLPVEEVEGLLKLGRDRDRRAAVRSIAR